MLATGIFGWRTYILFNLDKNVKKEASGSRQGNNPLSRIFDVAEQNKGSDVETLELTVNSVCRDILYTLINVLFQKSKRKFVYAHAF